MATVDHVFETMTEAASRETTGCARQCWIASVRSLLAVMAIAINGLVAMPAGAGGLISAETAMIGSTAIDIYTFRPDHCAPKTLLIAFAGFAREAEKYRDRAMPLAERACLFVVAPRLDRERFPSWRYQKAGVWRDNVIMPKEAWTGPLLADIVTWAKRWTGQPDIQTVLFGHSAGGQFLSRIAAYAPPPGVHRIVVTNPSVHVRALLTEDVPYGFGGLADPQEAKAMMRRYLALPITIYLGTGDTKIGGLLVSDEPAKRQGLNRYERGKAVFAEAKTVAQENNWPFGWTLIEVPGAIHSERQMMNSPLAEGAFGLRPRAETARR